MISYRPVARSVFWIGRASFEPPVSLSTSTHHSLYNSVEKRIFSFAADYLSPWGAEDYWYVRVDQPPDALPGSEMASFLLGLGDSLAAYEGHATTYRSGTANAQLNRGMGPDFSPPHGLPPLYPPESYVSMAVPFGIEWANYWSRDTAETMGFSEAEHACLFDRWKRGPSGSVAFQLTPEPIELDRPGDIEALKAVYAAFPESAAATRNSGFQMKRQWGREHDHVAQLRRTARESACGSRSDHGSNGCRCVTAAYRCSSSE